MMLSYNYRYFPSYSSLYFVCPNLKTICRALFFSRQKVKKEKSSFKRRKVDHESDASGAEEDDKITPLPSKGKLDLIIYEITSLGKRTLVH